MIVFYILHHPQGFQHWPNLIRILGVRSIGKIGWLKVQRDISLMQVILWHYDQCDFFIGQQILWHNGEHCEGLQLLPGAEVLHQTGGPQVFHISDLWNLNLCCMLEPSNSIGQDGREGDEAGEQGELPIETYCHQHCQMNISSLTINTNVIKTISQGWFVAQTWYDSSSTIVFLVHQREVQTIPTFYHHYQNTMNTIVQLYYNTTKKQSKP